MIIDLYRTIDVETVLSGYDISDMAGINGLASMRQRNTHVFTMHHKDRAWFMIGISFAFGACHLAAWNWPFPSNLEKWTWRFASVGCMLCPILFALAHVITQAPANGAGPGITPTDKPIKRLDYPILPFYVLCRLYLTIEIFISIRSMPLAVYGSIRWLEYIPHL
jgi:hypothetical protein